MQTANCNNHTLLAWNSQPPAETDLRSLKKLKIYQYLLFWYRCCKEGCY